MKKSEDIDVVESSGNVYADTGVPNPEEMLAKAELAILIGDIIDAKGLTQKQAAEIMGIDQPKVSAILRGNISGFTIDRLFRFLNSLGTDIVITTKPHTKRASTPNIQVRRQSTMKKTLKRASA